VNLDGILPPVATPFTSSGEIDLAALSDNAARLMRTGLRGLVVLGSNGEAPFVDRDELARVTSTARGAVPADRLLIVGTGAPSTRQTLLATRAAAAEGADAVLVLTPSVFRSQMTADALVPHYRAIADDSPVPVLLYNFPAATGVTLPVGAVEQLSAHPNIVGVKESSGDVAVVADLVSRTPEKFSVVVGAAASLYASLVLGADGGVVAVANVIPELCVRLHTLVRAGNHGDALALQRAITPLARAVTTDYGVAGLKAAMDIAGYRGGVPRMPLRPASDDVRKKIAALYESVMTAA
jgi:4-hydroxy-2-oxoglutarate aldolase